MRVHPIGRRVNMVEGKPSNVHELIVRYDKFVYSDIIGTTKINRSDKNCDKGNNNRRGNTISRSRSGSEARQIQA